MSSNKYVFTQTGAEIQGLLNEIPELRQGLSEVEEGLGELEDAAYVKPESGIPESDLTSDVQRSLNDSKGYNIVEMDVRKSFFGINSRNTHAIANGIPTTFQITLPTISDETHIYGVSVQLVTGSNSVITFTGARPVCYEDGYQLDANSCYNIEVSYNGTFWSVTATKMASFVVLTGNTNSVLFQLCYAQGWTSNSKMDNTEAAAVTDIGEVFRAQTTLSSFNELSYFIGLTSIPANAFTECRSMSSIILPETITSIGEEALMDCTALEEITIPKGVTTIGARALKNCSALEAIHVKKSFPPSLGTDAFLNTNDCPIYVPADSLSAYQGMWTSLYSRIQAES